jgi:hypothetical protein
VIARAVDEWDRKKWGTQVHSGYDPYNSAERAVNARIDALIRRGFKYLENHPQMAAEVFARSLAIHRKMEKSGAQRFDCDTFISRGSQDPI